MLSQWHERNTNLSLMKRDINNAPVSNPDTMDTNNVIILPSSFQRAKCKGVEQCAHCAPLWIGLARLIERILSPAAARAVLERAQLFNKEKPNVGALRREKVFLEVRYGGAATRRAGASAAAGRQTDILPARATGVSEGRPAMST